MRQHNLSSVRSRNTKPELFIRSGLHALGFRFRLHCTSILGRPDLVFKSRKVAIFVHGCFWHCHQCHDFRWPKNRSEWWKKKLLGNRKRDQRVQSVLNEQGWRFSVVWECAVKHGESEEIFNLLQSWLLHGKGNLEIELGK